MSGDGWTPRELRAVAEAIVDVLEERGLVAGPAGPSRVLNAAEVAGLLGRDRQWVYDHAGELGAFRFGNGPRARIGFDLATLDRGKNGRQLSAFGGAPSGGRRSTRSAIGRISLIPYEGSGRA
jgi:hypothetical protein